VLGEAMLDESSDPARPAMTRVKNQPAFTMTQSMLDRVKIETHSLQQVSILYRRLFDERITIGHSRLSVCAASGTNRHGASLW
jgi:hypothetical protein